MGAENQAFDVKTPTIVKMSTHVLQNICISFVCRERARSSSERLEVSYEASARQCTLSVIVPRTRSCFEREIKRTTILQFEIE